jgi:hypothetical protein
MTPRYPRVPATNRGRLVVVGCAVVTSALAVPSSGCRDATEIAFEVRTDLACTDVNDTTISLGAPAEVDGKAPAATATTTCVDGRIGLLVVTPSGDNGDEVGVRVVTGVAGTRPEDCVAPDYKGCIVARRALRYRPHTRVKITVPMRASCKDVPCDAAAFTTCAAGGACVDAHVDSATCEGAGCGEATFDPCATPPVPAGMQGSGWLPIPPLSTVGIPGRSGYAAVWGCREMYMWGGAGTNDTSSPAYVTAEGFAFAPATGTWRKTATPAMLPRLLHTAVWTGSTMIVWGGLGIKDLNGDGKPDGVFADDGAAYDAASDTWTPIPPDPVASARVAHSAVWSPTTQEMIVWGGAVNGPLADGAAYSPSSKRWRAIAKPPAGFVARDSHVALFANGLMTIFGGENAASGVLTDAASYDPRADRWTLLPSAPIPGRGVAQGVVARRSSVDLPFVVGAAGGGALFDGKTWSVVPPAPATLLPEPDRGFTALWYGAGRIWTWGGAKVNGLTASGASHDDGASFDLVAQTWSAMPRGPLTARFSVKPVWTGSYAILVGGVTTGGTILGDGAIYVP